MQKDEISIDNNLSSLGGSSIIKKASQRITEKLLNQEFVIPENDVHNYTREEVINSCNKIYVNFAEYYKEKDNFGLSSQSVIKILKAINLLDEKMLKRADVDIIIKKLSPKTNKLDKKQFLEFLVQICLKIDSTEFRANPRNAMNILLGNFLIPFAKYIEEEQHDDVSSSTLVNKLMNNLLTNYEVDYKVVSIINNIYYALKEIYIHYFHYEINNYKDNKKIENGSYESLVTFSKEFEILPYLISEYQLICYYKLAIKIDPRNLTNNNSNPEIIEAKKDIGICYMFSKFCLAIIHFAISYYNKNNKMNYSVISESEKVLLFLERLETSKGFQNLEKRTSKPHTSKLTLIPSKDVIKMINPNLIKTFHMNDDENPIEIKQFNEKLKNKDAASLRTIMSISNDVFDVINSRIHILKDIFLEYSKSGDKFNLNKMNLSGYIRFLKDYGILTDISKEYRQSGQIKTPLYQTNLSQDKDLSMYKKTLKSVTDTTKNGQLSESDVNLVFYSLTGPKNFIDSDKIKQQFDKNSGFTTGFSENNMSYIVDKSVVNKNNKQNTIMKMDFNLFMKSFELISMRIYPELKLNRAFVEFFKKYLSNELKERLTVTNSKNMKNYIKIIRNPEIADFIIEIHDIILPYYNCYMNTNGLICFEQFFEFYKDFSIFPDIVNMNQIKNIFFILSETLIKELNSTKDDSECNENEKKIKSMLSKNEFINYNIFLESLCISAMCLKFSDHLENLEKLFYFIERMNESPGIQKALSRKGNTFSASKDMSTFLLNLKDRYPQFYSKKLSPEVEKEEFLFDKIYND